MGSSEYMISDYYRILYLSDDVQLVDMLQVLILLIWIRVGIRILREVKGQHFANDAISLLWMEEKAEYIQPSGNHISMRFLLI